MKIDARGMKATAQRQERSSDQRINEARTLIVNAA